MKMFKKVFMFLTVILLSLQAFGMEDEWDRAWDQGTIQFSNQTGFVVGVNIESVGDTGTNDSSPYLLLQPHSNSEVFPSKVATCSRIWTSQGKFTAEVSGIVAAFLAGASFRPELEVPHYGLGRVVLIWQVGRQFYCMPGSKTKNVIVLIGKDGLVRLLDRAKL